MLNEQFTLAISEALARTVELGVPGQIGTLGEPEQADMRINGSRIQASNASASVTVIGETQTDKLTISFGENGPVKLVLEHPPLNFINAEIDLDITPAGELTQIRPVAADQLWIELGGIHFDQVAFTPQDVLLTTSGKPFVGTLVLSQGGTPVYTLNNVQAAHYGGLGGGQFSAGLDAQTGYNYVAYGPAQST